MKKEIIGTIKNYSSTWTFETENHQYSEGVPSTLDELLDSETVDGEMEQKHVSVNCLEPAQKTYNKEVMEALRQCRGLEPCDTSQDSDIMSMAKQDAFNEYCRWNGILGGYGYLLLNVVEDIYDINLQQ